MEFNNKKLERTSKLINYAISIVLCIFLISLSNRIIDDIDDWKDKPTSKQFENEAFLDSCNNVAYEIQEKIELNKEKRNNIKKTIRVAKDNYENAKKSYDNWLEARKTVGLPREDKEVLSRVSELDEYYKTEQKWREELIIIEKAIEELEKSENSIDELILDEKNRASKKRIKAIRKYELKVFLIRLLIILPILLLGIYFIVKFRKHKYWPLFLGFVLFSFYAFFFGLVPHLPSYGGYIRYAVGIIICVALGIYAINRIKSFIERKKKELKESTTERAKKVQIETAEKAFDNHMCPSCGKDFIHKKWDVIPEKKNSKDVYGVVTKYCRFCGLELFKECDKCGSENFAHLPYCSNCGNGISSK